MKKILVLCCVASLFCGCSRFLEEYSQDLAKVETFSDLDEVLLGKGYLPSGRFENNTYLCTAIENKTIAKHVGNDWRDGRMVDCGGLENR